MPGGRRRPQSLEAAFICLVAAHSAIVGAALLFLPGRWFHAFGWREIRPLFFARQAGVFHVVVAIGYLAEYFSYGGVRLLLIAKSIAVCFLLAMMLSGPAPWVVPFSAVFDGFMAVTAYLVHRWATGRRRREEAQVG